MSVPAAALLSLVLCSATAPFEVPAGFEPLDARAWAGSAALLPTFGDGAAPRELRGAWAEPGPDGASLAHGFVAEVLPIDAQTRTRVASGIASHFRSELGLEISVDRPELVGGTHAPRVEVRARTGEGAGERAVRYALFPAGGGFHVLIASYPPGREPALAPALSAAFESMKVEAHVPADGSDGRWRVVRVVAFGAIGVLVAIAIRLRRRPARG